MTMQGHTRKTLVAGGLSNYYTQSTVHGSLPQVSLIFRSLVPVELTRPQLCVQGARELRSVDVARRLWHGRAAPQEQLLVEIVVVIIFAIIDDGHGAALAAGYGRFPFPERKVVLLSPQTVPPLCANSEHVIDERVNRAENRR